MVWFFTIISVQILCWALVVLLFDGYHISFLRVLGNWIPHAIEDNKSKIKFDTEVKINSAFIGLS